MNWLFVCKAVRADPASQSIEESLYYESFNMLYYIVASLNLDAIDGEIVSVSLVHAHSSRTYTLAYRHKLLFACTIVRKISAKGIDNQF